MDSKAPVSLYFEFFQVHSFVVNEFSFEREKLPRGWIGAQKNVFFFTFASFIQVIVQSYVK